MFDKNNISDFGRNGRSKNKGKQQEEPSQASPADILPINIEAEQAVIGSVVIDPEALVMVDYLTPEDFYRDSHREIFRVMKYLLERHIAADFITICDELDHRHKLEEVGGASYLTSLINTVPTSGNVDYYANIVETLSVRRRLMRAAGEIAAAAMNDTADEALQMAEEAILSINNERDVTTYEPVSNIMSRCIERMNEKTKDGMIGVPTGFPDLDRLLRGLRKKALYILAARPAIGKTSLCLNIGYNAAKRGAKVAMFSLEMGAEELGFRLISMETRIDSTRIQTGQIDDNEWENIERKMSEISESTFTIDETGGLSVDQLFSRVRQMQAKSGLDLIIVDYLQLLNATRDGKAMENRVNEISVISRKLKVIAKKLDVPVLALAQLSRSLEARQSKVPILSDLRESGQIEADADVVMFIYRDEYYNPESERKNQADIIIAKNRSGPVGEITLRFTPSCTRFDTLEVELDEEEN